MNKIDRTIRDIINEVTRPWDKWQDTYSGFSGGVHVEFDAINASPLPLISEN